MRMKSVIVIAVMAIVGVFTLSACDDGGSGQEIEQASGQNNYNRLAKQEPAKDMQYSATRKTINFFTDTWGKGPKTAYLYLMNNEGSVIGYYVLEGPPVSMCTALRPPYMFVGTPDDGAADKNQQVPAPGTDGAFYSGQECNTYYGKDANSGAYIQYTAGQGINPLLYDQPLSPQVVKGAPNLATGK